MRREVLANNINKDYIITEIKTSFLSGSGVFCSIIVVEENHNLAHDNLAWV